MISKEEALSALHVLHAQVGAGEPERGHAIDDCVAAIEGITDREAMIIVHARWVEQICVDINGRAKTKMVCNACQRPNKVYTPPWCPHCGARMDLT